MDGEKNDFTFSDVDSKWDSGTFCDYRVTNANIELRVYYPSRCIASGRRCALLRALASRA